MYLPHKKLIIDQDIYINSKLRKKIFSPFFSIRKILLPGYHKFEKQIIPLKNKQGYPYPIYIINIHTHTKNMGFKKIIFFVKESGAIILNKIIYKDNSFYSFRKKNITYKKISNDIFSKKPIPKTSVIKNPFFF